MKIVVRHRQAFTLLEVAIAMGIFFVAMFSILELTSQSLKSARLLTINRPGPASVLSDLVMTNQFEEGYASGDFGELYPDYAWERVVAEVRTNGLYHVDVRVMSTRAESTWHSDLTVLMFRPNASSSLGSRARSRRR